MPTMTIDMYRSIERSPLVRVLKASMGMALTCALALLAVSLFSWRLAGPTSWALLSAVGILVGTGTIYLLLRIRTKAGPAMAAGLTIGATLSGACLACFLWLVWAGFGDHPVLWRLWWLTLVTSAAIAVVGFVWVSAQRRGGAVESATDALVGVAAVLLLWPGLRSDMLAGLGPVYWWAFTLPAFCAGLGVLYILVRLVLGVSRPGHASKSAAVVLLLITHAAAIVCAYEIGKTVSSRRQAPAATQGNR